MDPKYHKKTILQVLPSLISGGVERGTIEIAKKIVESGYQSIVVSNGGVLVNDLLKGGSIHITLNVKSKNPIIILKNIIHIIKIIKKYNVDVIHVRSRAPAWSCFFASRITKTKFITTFHGIYSSHNFFKKFYNSVMIRGDKVIAVSNFVKKHIINVYYNGNIADNDNRIIIINRGVDVKYFSLKNITNKEILKYREKYNLLNGVPVILLPGRVTRWKGHITLIEALHKLRNLKFFCLIVGDITKHKSYVQKVESLINKYKMSDKVRIFGNESNIPALYALSNIVISASIEPEAFGRTIIEAQSMHHLVLREMP